MVLVHTNTRPQKRTPLPALSFSCLPPTKKSCPQLLGMVPNVLLVLSPKDLVLPVFIYQFSLVSAGWWYLPEVTTALGRLKQVSALASPGGYIMLYTSFAICTSMRRCQLRSELLEISSLCDPASFLIRSSSAYPRCH